MSDIAISASGLGKRYRIGALSRQMSMREKLTHALKAPARWVGSNSDGAPKGPREFWALRDVSFEMKRGEVVGLIGRNGAGKSTLLKILSRVTQPTVGNAEIFGRVGSLLEVGTGFHPELTGRENTFLNGAILGMGKREIDRKFDEIVAFAEVANFIDTPIKHYSTGMQMRLAFAVAAHLEPETLLVDEVLAVGDLAFQKKCLGKMSEVASGGRTIVFVSHQLNQIRRLCTKAIWLDHGTIRKVGSSGEVLGAYESEVLSGRASNRDLGESAAVKARFVRWEITEPRLSTPTLIDQHGPITVQFTVDVRKPIPRANHGIALYDSERRLIWGNGARGLDLGVGIHEFTHELSELPLKPGVYSWLVTLWDENDLVDTWEAVPELIVGTQPLTHWLDEWAGMLNVPSRFTVSQLQEKDT
jgi:ABC-type polysaccharide/polyol phosphate transport system ATPase subunit